MYALFEGWNWPNYHPQIAKNGSSRTCRFSKSWFNVKSEWQINPEISTRCDGSCKNDTKLQIHYVASQNQIGKYTQMKFLDVKWKLPIIYLVLKKMSSKMHFPYQNVRNFFLIFAAPFQTSILDCLHKSDLYPNVTLPTLKNPFIMQWLTNGH